MSSSGRPSSIGTRPSPETRGRWPGSNAGGYGTERTPTRSKRSSSRASTDPSAGKTRPSTARASTSRGTLPTAPATRTHRGTRGATSTCWPAEWSLENSAGAKPTRAPPTSGTPPRTFCTIRRSTTRGNRLSTLRTTMPSAIRTTRSSSKPEQRNEATGSLKPVQELSKPHRPFHPVLFCCLWWILSSLGSPSKYQAVVNPTIIP
mmetsp:Transcript_77510/g.157385  ORF Transcript_77510/g.157385 Transcript_77510/m.157385 type:complete len:205 (-) Transcript_77510:101-715(-)